MELSIIMPCLNEGETLEACIVKAQRALREGNIRGEIIIADNGSTDNSREIAERCGARVARINARGYGNALMGGIAAAQGKYIMMGDADDSYDFLEAPRFLEKLRQGCDLVQGCRLPSGGGTVAAGAMPWSHRWIGNPAFTIMAQRMFRSPIHDINCGMRAFSREFYESLDMRCTGMEFAVEMIIKASLRGVKIGEIPITLHRDGRISHKAHLRTIRDGWRTLRFYLVHSPRWLFFNPGLLLVACGLIAYGVALPGLRIRGVHFDVHTLLFGSLAILLGWQSIIFALMAKTFAVTEKILPEDPRLSRFFKIMTLEKVLLLGSLTLLSGLLLLACAVGQWWAVRFGNLDYDTTMRWVIPGVTLSALGFQTVLSGFFVSILGMARR